MSNFVLYHNPRCSKSRAALELLQERGIEPTIVKYLDEPLSAAAIKQLLDKLGISARELIRSKEDAFDELGLANMNLAQQQLIEAMAMEPSLIERPILADDNRAVIGRPTEKLLEIIQ